MSRRLPGLDFIRFYAALSVMLAHAVFYRGCPSNSVCGLSVGFLTLTARDAVILFFVLSGFLITYLLLVEQQQNRTISAVYFYARRSLRIFPLYYFVVVVSVLIAPTNTPHDPSTYLAVALMSPHLVIADLYILAHIWSIGVEEWFYMTWAVVMKRFRLLWIVAGILGIRLMLVVLVPELASPPSNNEDGLLSLLRMLSIEAMAIGALGAWLYFEHHWALQVVYRLQPLCLGLMALLILFPFSGGALYNMAIAFVFTGFILNVSTNPKALLKLEHPLFNRLGQVTYGMYMYHLLVIYVVGMITQQILVGDAVHLGGVVALDIGVALLSYRFLELPFLKRKPYVNRMRTQPSQIALQEQTGSPVS